MKESKTTEVVKAFEGISTVDVIKELDSKISNMQKIQETPYRTTGLITGFNNIMSETDISKLIKAYSSVAGRERAYDAAAAELGLTKYPKFSEGGGDSQDHKHDISLRISIIKQKEDLEKLNEFKEGWSEFLSKEDQKEMLLKKMSEYFGGK